MSSNHTPNLTDGSADAAPPSWLGPVAVVGLYAFALFVLWVRVPLDQALVVPLVAEHRSEYSAHELFTRLLCVGIVVAGLVATRSAQSKGVRLASAVFTVFGVVLYASETNLVANKLQPVFAAGFAPVVLWLLWRHARRAFWPVVLGGCIGVLALVADVLHDRGIGDTGLLALISHNEEKLDMLSLTAFAHAAWTLRRGSMQRWLGRVGLVNAGLLLLACLAVVVGQSFAHWQYHIPAKQQAVAIALAWAGTLAALWLNERRLAPGTRLGPRDRAGFIAVGFLAGAVVPIFYGGRDGRLDLLFWPLIIVALVLYLCRARWEEGTGPNAEAPAD